MLEQKRCSDLLACERYFHRFIRIPGSWLRYDFIESLLAQNQILARRGIISVLRFAFGKRICNQLPFDAHMTTIYLALVLKISVACQHPRELRSSCGAYCYLAYFCSDPRRNKQAQPTF